MAKRCLDNAEREDKNEFLETRKAFYKRCNADAFQVSTHADALHSFSTSHILLLFPFPRHAPHHGSVGELFQILQSVGKRFSVDFR